ncbi:MAG TPA: glutathione S-transferase family protein [Polyangiaceae bacterium]
MTQPKTLKLVSFDLCPYVERSRIVLGEKNVPYEIAFVDLKNKPQWLLDISPRGKVPVLLVDDKPVFESTVINELLEELYPEPRLFPKEPFARAEARAWIVFCNDVLMMPNFEMVMASTAEARAKAKETLVGALGRVEKQLEKSGGKFFFGDDFGLVDCVYAPFLARFEMTTRLAGGPKLESYPRLAAYAKNLFARKTVLAARAENFVERNETVLKERMAANAQ